MFPVFIKMQSVRLTDFADCEFGAHEDEMKSADGNTAYEILTRHKDKIELKSINEAVYIADAAVHGSFQVHYPRIADRVFAECTDIEGVREAYDIADRAAWQDFFDLVKEVQGAK